MRKRKTNKGLPRRVYLKNGAYRYLAAEPMMDPRSKRLQRWIHLATVEEGESRMLIALGELLGAKVNEEGSMPHLCAMFKAERLNGYSKTTIEDYGRYLDQIAADFEEFQVGDVRTRDWSEFLKNNYKGKANSARKITALARKVFRYGISELGLRQDNPLDQVDLSRYKPEGRTAVPTHEQLAKLRAAGMESIARKDTGSTAPTASGPMFACIIDMAYLLWQRAIDIRLMREEQIVDRYIRMRPTKTAKSSGKAVDILITPAIQEVIDRARRIKAERGIPGDTLFPSKSGKPYTKSGLSSMLRRAKDRAGLEGEVTFKDIRARAATDAALRGQQREEIQKRLAHTSAETTEIYIKELVPDVSELAMALPWKPV
ncbi:tyrosine-type recombinase/integrase [Massilia endophytica]|uniref:tyrosine-type recombinase/integrase n=1 Tax=Massilia endophytica TaxID=2899220 RepID=UPI001E47D75F|nr:tyrosine-type recombinase/integrase [Massilia endophytica]UGQ44932.1 tyrosine-type recombinase/integrase [Massilia endophytica]